ncbi:NAD(P)-binding protein [Aquibacillus koreensis]|uniref:precorrin-2 dehydrogenase n=1 Tax=Aquibacillus koreensis TaxID=279446 RepID=A0A9X3WP00_9BACI|nr:NAD(P)-binding protein [Aquibacillus koreensis]MCT2534231.1 NAD(P)-binding protein [Aquibacillus koreensis]MDC3420724.1 NAD(P)-binding protein [Aquibacillus koreensis]
MSSIPIMLDLKGKKILVIGGGKIAERKITNLLPTEGSITVISPSVTPTIEQLSLQNKILWKKKSFSPEDVHDVFLCVIATNSKEVNKQAVLSAPDYLLINHAEDATQGNIQFPIQVKRGKLSIAISTDGASPILAKNLKREIEQTYDERYEAYLDFLFEARTLIKESTFTNEEKKRLLELLVTNELLDRERQFETLQWINEQMKETRR